MSRSGLGESKVLTSVELRKSRFLNRQSACASGNSSFKIIFLIIFFLNFNLGEKIKKNSDEEDDVVLSDKNRSIVEEDGDVLNDDAFQSEEEYDSNSSNSTFVSGFFLSKLLV